MRAGLLVGGLIFFIVGLAFDLTIIGIIIGVPIGFIGFIMMLVGLFTSSKSIQNITISQTVDSNHLTGAKDPLATLKQRYANGEITKAEFEEMKKDLT